jgi:hypothetical protein
MSRQGEETLVFKLNQPGMVNHASPLLPKKLADVRLYKAWCRTLSPPPFN